MSPERTYPEIDVLVVEDLEDDYTYVAHLLGKRAKVKYRLTWAKSYGDGLRWLGEKHFEVCLCDYKLGGQNGIDFIKDAQQADINCPVILLTGWDDPDIDYVASEVGAADYLSKTSLDVMRLEKSIRYVRRHAQVTQALRQTRKHLDLFLKHMPCAMAMKSGDGKYLYANEAMTRLLQHQPLEILGKQDSELLDKENARMSEATDQAVIASLRPQQLIQRVKTPKHEQVWLASKFLIPDREGEAMLGVAAIEITDRVRTEERLRETHQLLAAILETLPVIAGRVDEKDLITEIAGSGLRRFGLHSEQLIGKPIHTLPLIHEKQVRKAVAGQPQEFFADGVDEKGSWNYSVRLMFDGQKGRGAIFFAQDQTERRQLEKQLLEISDHRQETIGRDLHDGLGQHLTGISCLASVLADKLKKASRGEAEQAQLIADLTQEAIEQTRALARGLCPVQLETDGLKAAFQDLVDRTSQFNQVECILEAEVPEKMHDQSAAIHLYRIAQEAINNALRHGHATEVRLQLKLMGKQGRLTIEDNGQGFDDRDIQSRGLGLHMMQFRANLIGGTFYVASRPSLGTRITCELGSNSFK